MKISLFDQKLIYFNQRRFNKTNKLQYKSFSSVKFSMGIKQHISTLVLCCLFASCFLVKVRKNKTILFSPLFKYGTSLNTTRSTKQPGAGKFNALWPLLWQLRLADTDWPTDGQVLRTDASTFQKKKLVYQHQLLNSDLRSPEKRQIIYPCP